MDLLSLAFKDIARRKAKSLYLLVAIAIPVSILSTVLLTMDNADRSLSTMASKFGFSMIVQPKTIRVERIDQIGVVIDQYLPETVIDSITGVIKSRTGNDREEIVTAPRLYQRTPVSVRASAVSTVVAGIDFPAELAARPSWSLTAGRWPADQGEAVVGGTYARANRLSEQDTVAMYGRTFRVTGVLQNYNASEDYMVFVPFREFQELAGKKGLLSLVNVQNVSLDRDRRLLAAVVGELNATVPDVKSLAPQQFSTMKYLLLKKTFKFLLSIIAATVFVSIFAIFNIVTSLLYSRVRELGLLKAVGASRQQLLSVFLSQYAVMGLAAGVAAYPAALLMTFLLDSLVLNLGVNVRPSLSVFLAALASGVVCSLIAGFYPTYRLSTMKITDCFRTQWEV